MAVEHVSKGNDDGTTFGQNASDLISFYGVTPVVQPTAAAQAAAGITATTTTSPAGFATTTQGNNLINLVDAIRTALVNTGIMKGS